MKYLLALVLALAMGMAFAEKSSDSTLKQRIAFTPAEAREWSAVIGDALVQSANKVGVGVDEFIHTPTGTMVTAIIVYKVVGKDILRLLLAGPLFIIGSILTIYLWRKGSYHIKSPTKFKVLKYFGIPIRRAVEFEYHEAGDPVSYRIVSYLTGLITLGVTLCLVTGG